jgi:hypothetical protein
MGHKTGPAKRLQIQASAEAHPMLQRHCGTSQHVSRFHSRRSAGFRWKSMVGGAQFQRAVQALYFCHPERDSVHEGSAVVRPKIDAGRLLITEPVYAAACARRLTWARPHNHATTIPNTKFEVDTSQKCAQRTVSGKIPFGRIRAATPLMEVNATPTATAPER